MYHLLELCGCLTSKGLTYMGIGIWIGGLSHLLKVDEWQWALGTLLFAMVKITSLSVGLCLYLEMFMIWEE